MTEQEHTSSNTESRDIAPKRSWAIPAAIVIAGALIAGAIFLTNTSRNGDEVAGVPRDLPDPPEQLAKILDAMDPITDQDHILGSIDAPVKIVEYSDMECPFCKRFHETMQRVYTESDGKVAWVYRHFPLDSLHPVKARKEAVASECAAEQGGNEMFWRFTNRMFELSASNNQTDLDTVLPQIADALGLDATKFFACIEEERYMDKVEANMRDAVETGGRGTPWSIIVTPNGNRYPINGAQPYEVVRQIVDAALRQE